MRIVAISDTHTLHEQIKEMPEGDVLVHAGDFTGKGDFFEVRDFNQWLGTLPYKHKIVIAGNHELTFEERSVERNQEYLSNAIYLQGNSIEIDKVHFWGGPWTPRFYDWEFNVDRGMLHRYWDRIPEETNVLITHGPPRGIMDISRFGDERVGCNELLERVEQLPNLLCHIFGHLHSGYGTEIGTNGVIFVNAAICDERYEVHRNPIVIDI